LALKHGDAILSNRTLRIAKMMDKQLWDTEHPLAQMNRYGNDILNKLSTSRMTIERMKEMPAAEIGTN